MLDYKKRQHILTLIQFAITYTIIYMILDRILTTIGFDWWLYGIIFILIGIIMYFRFEDRKLLELVADYLLYVGTSFILYDLMDWLQFLSALIQ